MKLTENYLEQIDKEPSLELQIQQKKQVEYLLKGHIVPDNGHTVFEINIDTLEIFEASYKTLETVNFNDVLKKDPIKLIVKPGYVYIPATQWLK